MQNNYVGERSIVVPVNSFEDYPMTWKPVLSGKKPPLYKALANLLEEEIQKGTLNPGDMLPPQRELADYLDINLSTVSRAFKICEQKGLISGTIGKGTFISTDVNVNSKLFDPLKTKGFIEMGATYPSHNQNEYVIKFIKNMLEQPHIADSLKYASSCGTLQQKLAAVKWLKKTHLQTTEDHILLAAGSQNALCVILSSLFQSGDRIGTDPIIYAGLKTLANMLGIQLVPIQQENNEMSPAALRNYCKNEELKGIYLIPDHHNPTTHCMSLVGRNEIASISKEYNLILIEDAISSSLNENPEIPMAMLAPEQTIHISSTSKALCGGLRISFIVTPSKYKHALELALYNINLMVSPFNAEIVCRLIESSLADKIIQERQESIVTRNRIADSILNDCRLLGDKFCNFRWLLLPEGWTGKAFETCAKSAGVQIYCAERFAVGNALVPAAVRIAITAPKDLAELETGLNILKSILSQPDEFTIL